MLAFLAIAFSQVHQDSGAATLPSAPTVPPRRLTAAAPEKCPSARKAVPYYRSKTWQYQDRRGAAHSDRSPNVRGKSCHWAQIAAAEHQARARSSRKAYEGWSYEWEWEKWLPAKWRRVFHCETPTNGQYINWQHHAGSYEGGPGFYSGTWDQYKPDGAPSAAYLATPREQYEAAENVRAAVGYGAWGCGGA